MAKDREYNNDIDDNDDIDEVDEYDEYTEEKISVRSSNDTARRRIEELREEMYLRKLIDDNYLELD